MMKYILSWLIFFCAAVGAITPEDIVERADRVRNPGESYYLKVEVKSTGSDPSLFQVAIKGGEKTLIETIKPTRDKGRNLLMLDENMWTFIPNLKRAVRVSLHQKLSGEAANGDISRMRWSGDYDSVIEGEDNTSWTLLLTANKKGLTYDKVRVWVEKESFHPIKAQYLTVGGKILKNAQFTGYREIASGIRPTEIIITDAVREDDKSVITILEMEKRDYPTTLFNKNTLGSSRL